MARKLNIDKVQIVGVLLSLVPFLLLLLQIYFGVFNFTADWQGRTFVLVNTLVMAFGFAMNLWKDKAKFLKNMVINFAVILSVIFLGGFGLNMLSTAGLDFGVVIDSNYFILDSLSEQVATAGIIIDMVVKSIVPAAVIIFCIVMFIMADTPDEYTAALIEGGVSIVLIIVFGLVQKFLL